MILKRRIGVGRPVRLQLIAGSTRGFDEGRIKLVLVLPGGGKRTVTPSAVTEDSVEFYFGKSLQPRLGRYSAIVYVDKDAEDQRIADFRDFVELVPFSGMESIEPEAIIAEGQLVSFGLRGMSAYEIWLSVGNEGTPSDFLDWIRNSSGLMDMIKALEQRIIILEGFHGITPDPEPSDGWWYIGQTTATRSAFGALTTEELVTAALRFPLSKKSETFLINRSCWFIMVPEGASVKSARYTAGGIISEFTKEEIENGFVSGVTHEDVVIDNVTYKVYVNRNTALINSDAIGRFEIE